MGNLINSTDLNQDIVWNDNGDMELIINSTNCPINLKANLKIDYDVSLDFIHE